MPEPLWIRDDVVLAIHRRQLAEHGGAEGVRDVGLLASALARPRSFLAYDGAKPDLSTLASAYAFGIVQKHPLVDGNKCTAHVVCRTFLILNGYDLAATRQKKCSTFLSLARGDSAEGELITWMREHLVAR